MKVKVPLEDTNIKSSEFHDHEKETHGFGAEWQRIDTEIKINHAGEVNWARSMP